MPKVKPVEIANKWLQRAAESLRKRGEELQPRSMKTDLAIWLAKAYNEGKADASAAASEKAREAIDILEDL